MTMAWPTWVQLVVLCAGLVVAIQAEAEADVTSPGTSRGPKTPMTETSPSQETTFEMTTPQTTPNRPSTSSRPSKDCPACHTTDVAVALSIIIVILVIIIVGLGVKLKGMTPRYTPVVY